MPLYTALFTDLSIEPIGSYVDVIRAVSGLHGSYELHYIEGFGLIDRDDRPDNAINRLAEKKVFALSVCSVEALYYCSDAIEAVAQQAKSSQLKADEMIKSAKREAINVLKQDCVAEEMAARRCERKVRNQILSKVPDWELIKTDESPISVDVPSPYCDELKRFRKLVSEENLDDLIARYPLHKSTVFDVIEKALKCGTRPEYQQMVLAQVQHDETFADKLKLRINDLSKALESEMSNPAGSL